MNYIQALKNHRLKVTPQRLAIVDILHRKGHINFDDLYKTLQDKFPALSLATIYKNINIMCSKLFITEVKIPKSKSVYELTKEEHSHIVCSKCNAILDINIDTSKMREEATILSQYTIEKSSIIFNGICPECKD
jgi:Fur family peroxide stress response transcriptional regulator